MPSLKQAVRKLSKKGMKFTEAEVRLLEDAMQEYLDEGHGADAVRNAVQDIINELEDEKESILTQVRGMK